LSGIRRAGGPSCRSDFEADVRRPMRGGQLLQGSDNRRGRPIPQLLGETVDFGGRPLRLHLHAPVFDIAHFAGQSQRAGLPLRPPAKSDSLNRAGYAKATSYHVCQEQASRPSVFPLAGPTRSQKRFGRRRKTDARRHRSQARGARDAAHALETSVACGAGSCAALSASRYRPGCRTGGAAARLSGDSMRGGALGRWSQARRSSLCPAERFHTVIVTSLASAIAVRGRGGRSQSEILARSAVGLRPRCRARNRPEGCVARAGRVSASSVSPSRFPHGNRRLAARTPTWVGTVSRETVRTARLLPLGRDWRTHACRFIRAHPFGAHTDGHRDAHGDVGRDQLFDRSASR